MNLQENIHRIKEVMEQTSLELKGKTLAPKFAPPENFGQSKGAIDSKNPFHNNPDLVIDVISAAIDTVPGVGNVVSFTIDEIHAISYFVRAAMTSGIERTENILKGGATAILGFFPVGGNIASAGIKEGIKKTLKLTPDQIQKWAISKGIIKYRILLDIKSPWRPRWWLFILKLLKNFGIDTIIAKVNHLRKALIDTRSYLQEKNLLTPELDAVFNTVFSWLEPPSPEELAVMEEAVDKGII
jgi:hypothetical protein